MKKSLSTIAFLFVFTSVILAQEFQGQAIYQSKTVFEMKLDSSRISPEQQKRFQEMMKSQFEKTYELNFNKTASIYKEQAKLEQPGGGQGRLRFFGGGSSNNTYYKDTKDHTFANQTELFGKNFLVKDDLPKLDWKLEKDSKMIGNYLCFKATALRKSNDRGFRFRGRRGNNNEKEEVKKDTVPKMTLVTAWYTPQIPVSQGPNEFWGLPGLILEVNYDKTMLLCTKIVLNPKDKKLISIPDNGKEVTQAAYDKIMAKKMKEMQDRYGGGQRRGNNGGLRIRFGN